jgi:hypothetical protein
VDIALINLLSRGEQLLDALMASDETACEGVSTWKQAVEQFTLSMQQPTLAIDVQKAEALISLADRLDIALGVYAVQLKAQQEAAQRQYQMAHKYIVNG